MKNNYIKEKLLDIEFVLHSIKNQDSLKAGEVENAHETCQSLIETLIRLETPTKPIIEPWCPAYCPTCDRELSEHKGDGYYKHWYNLENCECGQALDWQ